VNGVIYSWYSVFTFVCLCVRTQSSLQHCGSRYSPKAIKLYKSCKKIHLADICTLWAPSSCDLFPFCGIPMGILIPISAVTYTIKHRQEVSTKVTGVQSNLAKGHITNPQWWMDSCGACTRHQWAAADECKDSSTAMLHTAAQHSHYTLQRVGKWHQPKHCCFPWMAWRDVDLYLMYVSLGP